jgi:hypothetical protein
LVVILIVNNEEHLLRALADTGATNSIISEANTSDPFIKTDENNIAIWSTMGGKFTTTKNLLVTFSLLEFNPKKQIHLLGYFMWKSFLSYQTQMI